MKDHLTTPEETLKRQKRELKKVVSSTYQGAPPVQTRAVDQVGIVAKTEGEVKDTSFPILPDIDDLTDNIRTSVSGAQATITLELDKANAQFQRLKLDDNAGAITSFIIDMTGLAKNKALEFIADIQTVFTGTPTVTFQANGTPITIESLPTDFPDAKTKWKLLMSAIDTPTDTCYEVLSSAGDSGGGLTEPIILTPNVITQQTAPTKSTIDWSKNPNVITMTADTDFDFSNLPANGKYEGVLVIIDIDATGGYADPLWPVSVANPPVVPTTPFTRTSVMLYTINGGTTVTHATGVGSSSGGGTIDLGDLSDVTLGALADNNILAYDLGTGEWINQTASQAGVAQGDLGNLSNPTSINQDLLFNSIGHDIGNATFPVDNLFVGTVRLQTDFLITNAPSMTSLSGSTFDINFPLGSSFNIYENTVSKHTFTATTLTTPNIITPGSIVFNSSGLNPVANGEFRRNGTDVFVFSGNALRNLSDIGAGSPLTTKGDIFGFDTGNQRIPVGSNDQVLTADSTVALGVKWAVSGGANTALSNLTTTAINQALLFDAATYDIGDTTNPVDQLFFKGGRLQTGLLTTNVPSFTSLSGSTFDINFPLGSSFNIYENTVSKYTFSGTTFTAPNIILQGSLVFNSSGINPVANGEFRRNGNVMALQAEEFTVRNDTTVASEYSELSLIKIDATPLLDENVGRLNFGIDDSGTIVYYAGIHTEIKEVTDSGRLQLTVRNNNSSLGIGVSIEGDDDISGRTYATIFSKVNSNLTFGVENGAGGTFIIAPDSSAGAGVELGIVVQDNVGFTVGTNGTLSIPSAALPAVKTKANMDTALGTHKGAMGWDEGLLLRLWVRNTNGNWYGFDWDASVTV